MVVEAVGDSRSGCLESSGQGLDASALVIFSGFIPIDHSLGVSEMSRRGAIGRRVFLSSVSFFAFIRPLTGDLGDGSWPTAARQDRSIN